jgi:DNA-binding response OmpR family regulator
LKTLLLIDDEAELLDVMAEQIESFSIGVRVIKATSVKTAESLAPGADIIISDIQMPNQDRLEMLLSSCNKPVARISGAARLQDLFINKPFTPDELKRVILRLLDL